MEIRFQIPVEYSYRLVFTQDVFNVSNPVLAGMFKGAGHSSRAILFLDRGVLAARPGILDQIRGYFHCYRSKVVLELPPVVVAGGEAAKVSREPLETVLKAIHDGKICRHSFVIAVGGGSVLDMVGFAASIVHRGVRMIRIPTTVLAQGDAGLGIKNGINFFNKKNFVGTFNPPDGIINDREFLSSLDHQNWISGIAEAIKVAVIRDQEFFSWIHEHGQDFQCREGRGRNLSTMELLIQRSAELHLRQIRDGGDPFEKGSVRPLDYGHWIAHKLESLSGFSLTHGHAVAIGVAVDSAYSWKMGFLPHPQFQRIVSCLQGVGFDLRLHSLLRMTPLERDRFISEGLAEFREHLGGQLTLSMVRELGQSFEVHEIDQNVMQDALKAVVE